MSVKTVLLAGVLGLIVLVSLGAVAGAVVGWIKSPENWGEAVLAIAGAVAIGGFATLGILLLRPWGGRAEPVSPKTRKANKLLLLSGLVGGVLGAVLSLSMISTNDPFALFSNSPMPRAVVIPAIVVWLLIVPVISWQWHASVDEHEARSYQFGGLAALYLYGFVTPAWWLAWRGGLMAEPDAMLIFLGVTAVWLVGWFWRRYR